MPPLENPILLDVPPEIETERLLLRIPRPGDSIPLNAAARESEAELKPWFPWANPIQPPEKNEIFLREGTAKFIQRQLFLFLVWRKDDEKFLGSSSIHRLQWNVPRGEIGYWLRTSETGKGYATEVALALTDYGFNHLNLVRMEIWCDVRNKRSARVAERAGYTLESIIQQAERDVEGNLRDDMRFVRLAANTADLPDHP